MLLMSSLQLHTYILYCKYVIYLLNCITHFIANTCLGHDLKAITTFSKPHGLNAPKMCLFLHLTMAPLDFNG